jgi:hypothetical protein
MNVRVLICWHPGNLYQATVMTCDLVRGWTKVYPSKLVCAIDLARLGLLTMMEQEDVLQSDFDIKDKILSTNASVEAEELEKGGFEEIITAKVN